MWLKLAERTCEKPYLYFSKRRLIRERRDLETSRLQAQYLARI